jgi:hypothetical protein
LVEEVLGNQRFEVAALAANAVLRHVHDAGVQLVAQQHADRLGRERLPAAIGEPPRPDPFQELFFGVSPRSVLLERSSNERRSLGVVHQALAHRPRRIQVADRRKKHPSSKFQRGLHAGARAIGAHVIVELRKRCEDTFHQLAGGGVVDRLCRRAQRDPKRLQMRPQREMVVLVAGEARQVEHDHEVHAALVQPTEREQVLELAAICGLGALAFLVEAFEDFVSLAAAVLFARAKLCRQAEILGLLLRADANVDHRPHHDRQSRSIPGLGQAAFARHGLLRNAALLLVHLDHDARHRFGVTADVLDVLIGHRFRVLAEQLPTARDRNRFRPCIRLFDVLHVRLCEFVADVRDAVECARSAPTWSRRADDEERGCGVTPTPKRVT